VVATVGEQGQFEGSEVAHVLRYEGAFQRRGGPQYLLIQGAGKGRSDLAN
jgi:hypothetical protein